MLLPSVLVGRCRTGLSDGLRKVCPNFSLLLRCTTVLCEPRQSRIDMSLGPAVSRALENRSLSLLLFEVRVRRTRNRVPAVQSGAVRAKQH